MNLRASFSLLGACVLVALANGCAAPSTTDASEETNDSDLTQAPGTETAAAKIAKLTPLGDVVRREGARWSGREFRGTGEKGKACKVQVFHFDGPAVEIVVDDDGETNDMIVTAGILPSHLAKFRADDASLHFEDWWIEDQADRNHEVDVKRFDAPGGGISIRTKKLGFDKVVQCSNLTATNTAVAPPEHFGE